MATYEGLPRMAGGKKRKYTPPQKVKSDLSGYAAERSLMSSVPRAPRSGTKSDLTGYAAEFGLQPKASAPPKVRTYTPPPIGVAGVGMDKPKPGMQAKAGATFRRTPSKGMMGDYMDEKKQSPEYAMMQKAARRKYTPPSQADASAKPRKPADLLEEIDKYAKSR